jgi:uncharacterized protein (TIGR03083 family)
MSSNADRPISALRSGHDTLTSLVHSLSPEALTDPSGASEWTVAQVLSHLGSGAEIALATLEASLDEPEKPADGFNQRVWDRWNAMEPPEQAHHFIISNEKLVRRYESLDEATRNTATVDMGFLPAPVDVATAASFRLEEFALHSWDVAVASDPAAVLAADAVEPILAVIPFLIGWIGKPGEALDGRRLNVAVHTTAPTSDFGLLISDRVTLGDAPADPDADLHLPAESWLRLATGRLGVEHTPAEVSVAGPLTLAQLRQIFPGF